MKTSFWRLEIVQAALFLAVLLAAPLALPNEYYLSICILACVNAVVAVGLNLLLGYAGQVSLGHAAFYGLGAYVTALCTTRFGLPIPFGMGIGVVLATAVAWIVAVPTLKLRGHYLAMATLGFGIIVSIVFNESVEWTGGPSGFVGIPRLALFGYSFDSDRSYYNLLAVVLALVVLGSLFIMRAAIEDRLKLTATDNYGLSEIMGPGVAGECQAKAGMPGLRRRALWRQALRPRR